MSAKVISLNRYRRDRARAERDRRTLRVEGRTLMLEGQRVTLDVRLAQSLARGIGDALDGHPQVAVAGFVISSQGDAFRFSGGSLPPSRVTRGQLAGLGLALILETGMQEVVRG